jgi:hypothetical protein
MSKQAHNSSAGSGDGWPAVLGMLLEEDLRVSFFDSSNVRQAPDISNKMCK